MNKKYSITLPENEAEIYLNYGAAKGCKSFTDILRYFAEPVMNRNKVGNLHEELVKVRIKNAEIKRKKAAE